MSDLTDFLLARIGEDEEAAKAAARHWHDDCLDAPVAQVELHAYRHDPARVLAKCEAKRRIVEWCSERTRVFVGRLGDDPTAPANYVPGEYAHQDAPPSSASSPCPTPTTRTSARSGDRDHLA